jgi:hypothetical protein
MRLDDAQPADWTGGTIVALLGDYAAQLRRTIGRTARARRRQCAHWSDERQRAGALGRRRNDRANYIGVDSVKKKSRARIVALLAALCGYTFVNIEGDHNTVSDTGGHGGRVQMPERSTNANPPQRLI